MTADVAGIELKTVGLILMIAGALALVISLALIAGARRSGHPPRSVS